MPEDYIMFGKYQIAEEKPGLMYLVYYKDFGIVYRTISLVDALHWCLEDWAPMTIFDYRAG
jgi:hypothetical protein